jgi:hypothetical protein
VGAIGNDDEIERAKLAMRIVVQDAALGIERGDALSAQHLLATRICLRQQSMQSTSLDSQPGWLRSQVGIRHLHQLPVVTSLRLNPSDGRAAGHDLLAKPQLFQVLQGRRMQQHAGARRNRRIIAIEVRYLVT